MSCKMFEHIICQHVLKHVEEHNILTDVQHGFRSGRSCETQLLITLQDLLSFRDQGQQTDLLVLDFSKAFDTVPHDALLGKLQHYGIHGHILHWIAGFLKNREQCVVVDGARSSPVSVDSGVPQGTVLGPLLFLLHINDIQLHVSLGTKIRLFADDCLLYRPIKSVEDQVALQRDLTALDDWSRRWGMRFNATKCNLMRIARSKTPFTRMYSLSGHTLEEVQQAKYLGVCIGNDLVWASHIASVSQKTNSTLGFLRRNLKGCPISLRKQLTFLLYALY